MEDWRYYDNLSGTPQGGIISPLLANIYLNELDKYVEDTLKPQYTRGKTRTLSPEYQRQCRRIADAEKSGDMAQAKRLRQERRGMMSALHCEPEYRRLRYIRYADDFLLGFVGPKEEALEIRQKIGDFLSDKLRLTLSMEKTKITHATDDKATFLGYELSVTRRGDLVTDEAANAGRRATNGSIALLMPRKVVDRYRESHSSGGKLVHRTDLIDETDYTIIQRYQGVLRGLYNYYCMAINVSDKMNQVRWTLQVSLLKTLARKYESSVIDMVRRYRVEIQGLKALQVVIDRPGKTPLIATFGGFHIERIPAGMGIVDFCPTLTWNKPASKRSEVVQRLLAGKCELCDAEHVPTQVHHIRKLADLDRA